MLALSARLRCAIIVAGQVRAGWIGCSWGAVS